MPTFTGLPLHTARLSLRPLVEADAADLYAVFSDPRVMRYWSSPPWTAMSQALDNIGWNQECIAAGSDLRLGLQQRESGAVVGTCTLFGIVRPSRRAELGYGLGAASWGQGLMHEALVALLDYGFGTLDLHRVEADIDPRNDASRRTLQRLGFSREGLRRERWIVNGEISDTEDHGLLAAQWRRRGAPESPPAG